MKIALFAAFVCLAAALPNARQVHNLNNPERIPGEFLVVLHRPVGRVTNAQYANYVAGKIAAISSEISIVKRFTHLRTPILHIKASDEVVISQLFQIKEVDTIESNVFQQMIEQCSSQDTGSSLWGLSRISSVSVPDYSTATYSNSPSSGSGVRVYVLDTGIRLTHTDFGGRALFGTNTASSNDDDNNGHGSHCSGTAAGTQYGVSKAPTLVAVKVMTDLGFGSTAGIVEGIEWSVRNATDFAVRGVLSMSIGGGVSLAMDTAVEAAISAGLTVVVAAGNNNGDACNNSPARVQGAITVGATDINDGLSSFSNWGTCVDILAPGSEILSVGVSSDTAAVTFSGTSMACPHVAGAAARFLAENPTATPAEVKAGLISQATVGAINLRGTSGTPNVLLYSSCA